MGEKPEVLCVGEDAMVNRTRRLILQRDFEVQVAARLDDALNLLARQQFALVLLCSSVNDEDGRQIVGLVRSLPGETRILALGHRRSVLGLIAPDEEFFAGGPAQLLEKATEMAGMRKLPRAPGSDDH